MGIGAGAGLGITGYYEGKKMRNESESKDAAMRIQALEDRIREYEQADKIATTQEEYGKNRYDNKREKATREGRLYEAEGELDRATRKRAGEERTEGIAVKKQPGLEYEAEDELGRQQRTRAGELRTEGIAVKKQPGLEYGAEQELPEQQRKAKRGEQVAAQETQRYEDKDAHDTLITAIGTLKESGNTAAIDDWYRENMPNGHEVTTTKDPNVEGGYIMTDNNGEVKKVGSMQELLTNLETLRKGLEERIRSPGNLGPAAGQRGPDLSESGIGYGRGGGGRGGTQLERMYPQVVEDLAQQYPDMPEWELRLTAIKFLKERGGEPSGDFLKKWDAEMLQYIMGMSDIGGKRDKAMMRYYEYRKILSGETEPGAEGATGDDETTDTWLGKPKD